MTVVSLRTVPRPRARNARELAQQLDSLAPSVVPAPTVVVATAPYAPSGGLMVGSSQTPNQVAVGTQIFQLDQFGIGFAPGQRVRMAETAAPTTVWMEGAVLSYLEPILTVNVDLVALGVDTELYGPWSIAVTGMKGDKGDTGIQGPVGPTGPVPEAPNDTHYYVRHAAAWSIFETSPALKGTPTTPTPPLADNSQQIANTNFIKLNSQPLSPDLTSIAAAAAIGVMYYRSATGVWSPVTVTAGLSFSGGTLGVAGAGFAPLASPALTGTPTAPTAAPGTNTTQIATTAYVLAAGFAPLASPVFSGNPTGPSPILSDSSPSLSTTGWVTAKLASYAPLVSPTFSGSPQAPTPTAGDSSTKIATTNFVTSALGVAIVNLAPLASPVFTGTPRSTTAPPLNDYTNSIPTTKWVTDNVAALGGGIPDAPADSFNYGRKNSVWNNLDALFAPRVSPGFTGNPTAPTPPPGDSSTSIATTAFAQQAGFPSGTVMLFCQGTAPIGWTKSTTHDDKALRVTSGTTGGTGGGTNSFSSVMAQTAVGNHTLVAGEIPTITQNTTVYPSGNNGYYAPLNPNAGWATVLAPNTGAYHVAYPANNTTGVTYANAWSGSNSSANTGGGAHNHPLTMAMQYVDVILASKN